MAAADPGTTFVSATTRELAIGAEIEFVDRGTRELKGISGRMTIIIEGKEHRYELEYRLGSA